MNQHRGWRNLNPTWAMRDQIENLANLDALPATGATLVVGVLPVVGGSQAQARVIGLLP